MQTTQNAYHAIYLSPHLDDAALSCGGQIFQAATAAQPILIITIMAGDPPTGQYSSYAAELHTRWQLAQDVVVQRRMEDIAACHILQADYQHWPTPDCIYRHTYQTGDPLYTTWAEITGPIHADDQPLIQALTAQFQQLPSCHYLYAPLAVGNHVDHQIVRLAAEAAFGPTLRYYEDYPYAVQTEALEQVIYQPGMCWQSSIIPLASHALAAKANAVAAYESQVSTFFNGRTDLDHQLNTYAQTVGGERIWQKS